MYTFGGIAFTYLYQITYFAAVMAFTGEMEDQGRHGLFGIRALEIHQAGKYIHKRQKICRNLISKLIAEQSD